MPYIDYKYYTEKYLGEPVIEADFPRYERRAAEAIDSLTRFAIKQSGLASFNSFDQEQIKLAVAAQVEYYAINGLTVATDGIMQEAFTVGTVSVGGSSGNSGGNNRSNRSNMVAAKAKEALLPTGLLYAGV